MASSPPFQQFILRQNDSRNDTIGGDTNNGITSPTITILITIFVIVAASFIVLFFFCFLRYLYPIRNAPRRQAPQSHTRQLPTFSLADALASVSPTTPVSQTTATGRSLTSLSSGEASCPVCLDPLSERLAGNAPCSHALHMDCWRQWLWKDATLSCPVCRAPVIASKTAAAENANPSTDAAESNAAPEAPRNETSASSISLHSPSTIVRFPQEHNPQNSHSSPQSPDETSSIPQTPTPTPQPQQPIERCSDPDTEITPVNHIENTTSPPTT